MDNDMYVPFMYVPFITVIERGNKPPVVSTLLEPFAGMQTYKQARAKSAVTNARFNNYNNHNRKSFYSYEDDHNYSRVRYFSSMSEVKEAYGDIFVDIHPLMG